VKYVPHETLIKNYYLKIHLMLRAGQIQGISSRWKQQNKYIMLLFDVALI